MKHCSFCPSTALAIEAKIGGQTFNLCPLCAEDVIYAVGFQRNEAAQAIGRTQTRPLHYVTPSTPRRSSYLLT